MTSDTSVMQYLRPAQTWTEALPLGNGRLGAMVFGGPMEDVVSLNEETLWGRSTADSSNPRAASALERVRSLIFAGDLAAAQNLAQDTMLSEPDHFPPYEPLCDLRVTLVKPTEYSDYSRELDLESAIATTRFALDGVTHHRQHFVSAVDDVLAIRHSADAALPRMKFALHRCDPVRVRVAGSPAPMPGQAAGMGGIVGTDQASDPKEHILLMTGTLGGGGVDFVAGLSIQAPGAPLIVQYHWDDRAPHVMFSMSGGTEATLFLAAESTFRGGTLAEATDRVLDRLLKAEAKGFDTVRADHIADYRSLYNRFSLRLGDPSTRTDTPCVVPELIAHAKNAGAETRQFVELFVNYCRYLLISSSRPGTLPSNLQGIWNAERWPNWESDFHPNINLQLNYWPADPMGLPEVVSPVIDWLEATKQSGRHTARNTYNARGWTMNHISNAWGFTAPAAGAFGIWPMGGAWMALSLYDHYLHTMDRGLLEDRIYPLMKEASEFFVDFLVEGPENSPAAGYLVTAPSNSPENYFIAGDGTEATMTYGATMDLAIIDDLFTATLEALDTLHRNTPDLDRNLHDVLVHTRARLLPTKVSPTTGGIQEWAEDYREVDPGHRHVSALYGVFPGRSITPDTTPELARAAAHTIQRKFAAGYQAEAWGLGWIATILARLHDSAGALSCINRVLRELVFNNLFVEAHLYSQVGDMQGIPTAVLNMLAHSDAHHITLLPALPTEWDTGTVTGLRLRGGHELSMSWHDGQLTTATIHHLNTQTPIPDLSVDCPGSYSILQDNGTTTIQPA